MASEYFLVGEWLWGMKLKRDKYLPNSGLILCSLCMNCYIIKVMGALLAKKPMESQSPNVICIMGNKEIVLLRAECSLSPVGVPCTQGEQPRTWLCPLRTLSKKQLWPWLLLIRSGKKMWYFPSLLVFLSLCPNTAGMGKVLTLQFSPWVPILEPLEHPLHCRHCGQGKGQHFLAMDCFKGHCRIICFEWKYIFIVPSYQILYHCTVLNLQVFWNMNITSSCKGAVFKMLRQLIKSQPKHV